MPVTDGPKNCTASQGEEWERRHWSEGPKKAAIRLFSAIGLTPLSPPPPRLLVLVLVSLAPILFRAPLFLFLR